MRLLGGLLASLLFASAAVAQGAMPQGGASGQVSGGHVRNNVPGRTPRAGVTTQPSNNPFQNPIGQGVPPAASPNATRNGNLTNVPLGR